MKETIAYHSESGVDAMNQYLSVSFVLCWILAKTPFVLFCIRWVTSYIVPTEELGWRDPVVNPVRTSLEASDLSPGQFSYPRHNLNARRSIANDGDPFMGVVIVMIPRS
jgi:hypothetical protein